MVSIALLRTLTTSTQTKTTKQDLQSTFRTLSDHFQSNSYRSFRPFSLSSFRLVSEHYQSSFRAVLEQFQSSFRSVSEHFRSTFRAIWEQFQCIFRSLFRVVSEQFQSSFRALSVSDRFSSIGGRKMAYVRTISPCPSSDDHLDYPLGFSLSRFL